MNRISQVWWLPLARRVVGWGLAGALLWALPVVAAFGGLAFYAHLTITSPDGFGPFGEDWFVSFLLYFGGWSSAVFALMGAIAGAVAAIYALPMGTKKPFKSRFFRRVGSRTFWFFAATSLAYALAIVFLHQFFSSLIDLLFFRLLTDFPIPIESWCIFSVYLFALGLWRAVNRARSEAAKSNFNA